MVVDHSVSVARNLRTFGLSLAQGGLIIVLLVALVAGWRPAVAVVTALFLSIGISFGLMNGAGLALQQMSIVGLIIVLGLLVDNAIVVVEGIMAARQRGLEALEAAVTGTDRVASAVASSTATTIAAFVPMMRTEGSVGAFTRDIPIVVSIVLVVSLGIAIFVTPLVSLWLFRATSAARPAGLSPWLEGVVARRVYPAFLRSVIARPWRTVGGALLGVALAMGLAPLVGMNFFPAAEKELFLVQVECPTGTDIGTTDRRSAEVAAWLRERPEVAHVLRNVGRGNPQVYYNQTRLSEREHLAELAVTVTESAISGVPSLIRDLRDAFAEHPDFVVRAKPFVQGPPIGQPVTVQLRGPDLDRLATHAAHLEEALARVPGAVNVTNQLRPGTRRLDLSVDPEATARVGLSRPPSPARYVWRWPAVPPPSCATGTTTSTSSYASRK